MSIEHASSDDLMPSPAILELITRAKCVLSELECFRQRLRDLRQEGTVETGQFRDNLRSELNMLERLSAKPESESTNHVAKSSNLPFLEHVWTTAKRSRDVVALRKRVYLGSSVKALSQGMHHVGLNGDTQRRPKKSKDHSVLVDVIADGGQTWTKVSLINNTRLVFDLAKQGWDSGGSDSEKDDTSFTNARDDDDHEVPLVRTARVLATASKLFRSRTKTPSVRLVLPRVRLGEVDEVDEIIAQCRRCGVDDVICGVDFTAIPTIKKAVHDMALDPLVSFSETLNIDCTILLALVSEFSHAKVSKEPWFHTALQRQVEVEDSENLLPSLLYPALRNHKLVCTSEAAKRMQEIVATIGTSSEKARTAIFMGTDATKSPGQLVEELQQWSAYAVPEQLRLPIHVVDQNELDCQLNLPEAATAVAADLTAINRSVFIYGWATGRTTITSNRAVVKQIENKLEQFEDLEDEVFPKLWLCPTARSLVGKEKRGPKKGP